MGRLEAKIKNIARENGAALVGITTTERLRSAPPSGDPAYVLPGARSVISFAAALDRNISRAFLSKKDWRSHCEERKHLAQTLYRISDRVKDFLKDESYEAKEVDINNNYRPEPGAANVTEMTEFIPVFSHRYAAVAAGIGRLGWSGNVLTPEHGALVELGTVVTSAELEPNPLVEENPCDRCKLCTAACPVGMINTKEKKTVTIAGIKEEIAVKRPNTCCWIGCTGYHGLSPNRKWSNWSPYRLEVPLPQEKGKLDELNTRLQKADPQMSLENNSFTDYRKAMFDPEWFTNTVCGNCRLVCWKNRADRETNLKSLHNSGVVALGSNGEHVVATEDEITEIDTPYIVKVGILKSEYHLFNSLEKVEKSSMELPPIDAAVLKFLSHS
jgi:epoxyqueuosine reductase